EGGGGGGGGWEKWDLEVARRNPAPVERAKFGKLAGRSLVAPAEVVLAAGIERELLRQPRAMPIEKAEQPAVMVEMAVAHDQCLDLLRIGADIVDVVVERFRGVAEVDHHGVPLTGALGFYIERQAPLVVQRAAIIALAR